MTDQHHISGDYHKYPRLYIQDETCQLTLSAEIILDKDQSHYVHNVMRMKQGHYLRIFNGRDGDWLGQLTRLDKKMAVIELTSYLKPQEELRNRIHLYFAPIKKNRMDFLIEKSVEIGVTDLHPISMQFGQVHSLNHDRITRQMIEACEQSERQIIPHLHDMITFNDMSRSDNTAPILCCLERADAVTTPMLGAYLRDAQPTTNRANSPHISILIGPEGGFSPDEINIIHGAPDKYHCVSLGPNILRAETAAIAALSIIQDTINA